MTPVLEAYGLVKRYGRVTAMDGADFELSAGEVLAVVGDNGAGKSTLIKALSGAVVPDSGQILVEGKPVRTAAELRKTIEGMKPGEIVSLRVYNTQAKNRRIERIRLGD